MHPKTATTWCALWSGEIIGTYFFEDEEGNALTVIGERCCAQFFVPQLEHTAFDNMWFQHDSATCHTARDIFTVLHEFAPGCLILVTRIFRHVLVI